MLGRSAREIHVPGFLTRVFRKAGEPASGGYEPKEGDVFLVPLGDARFALGQLVSLWNDELYVVFYEPPVMSDASPERVEDHDPFLAVLTLDAKLWNGDWPIVGNHRRNLPSIAQPVFKVMYEGRPMVEARDRSWWRPARDDEFLRLHFRSITSPAVAEDIVKARFGTGAWLPGYDRYLYGYAVASASTAE